VTHDDAGRSRPRAQATCRHCGAVLEQRAGGWADADGFPACIKGEIHDPHPESGLFHQLEVSSPVFHEPMPAGLRGAA